MKLSLALTLVAGNLWPASGATLAGFLRDLNWYASYTNNAPGVGYYEFAINGNASNNAVATGASAATGPFGDFRSSVPSGFYTIASWDVWWRSAFAFNVFVSSTGQTPWLDLRLQATMWGYPAFWDNTGYTEFGQTFVASGPITMIYLRLPEFSGAPTYRLTIHEDGPSGAQVGEARTFGTGDQRPIYGHGQMPTVAGRTYYASIRTSPTAAPGVIMQMDPRPDFSDPMPGGCLWLGAQGNVQPYPERDLGMVIMSDDDGLITDMFTRPGGLNLSGSSIGQSFIARGVSLISVAAWLADPSAPVYEVRLRKDGPGGELVGIAKRGRPARVTADPEMLVTWAPGECPLTPGATYYIEITRVDGNTIYAAQANQNNAFVHGSAYQNGAALPGADLAGTIMEEELPGSALRRRIQITAGPQVLEGDRGTNCLVVRWTTDVASDSQVDFALDTPPYTRSVYEAQPTTQHVIKLVGLKPHGFYHLQVSSAAAGFRKAASRDIVMATAPTSPNLLVNPGFELGETTSSAARPLSGWTATAGLDIKEANGTWFWGLPPRSGGWLLEGAMNGSASEASVYQRVSVTPGKRYTFSAWLTTWMRENNTFKYDVWNDQGRLIYMRLGVDPTGGTSPLGPGVEWTPRMYSHQHWSCVAKTTVARGAFLTVFIHMKGTGGQWHLYGADDCVLTEATVAEPYLAGTQVREDGSLSLQVIGEPGVSNRVEISDDLGGWVPWAGFMQTNARTTYVDPAASAPTNRFYRAVLAQ